MNRRGIGTLIALLAGCGGGGAGGDGGAADARSADGASPPPACADGGTGPDATIPGAVTAPDPTIHAITLEWAIAGDADADGAVTVRYRVAGASSWRAGTPLLRVPAGSAEGFSWANRHSGSLFGLEADTSYEIELALSDPDGGCDLRTLTVRTRAVPAPMEGAPVIAVTPASFAAAAAAVQPGDILELGAGTYPGFDFQHSGSAGAPIVLRGTPGAVVDGNIYITDQEQVQIADLTVNGWIKLNGCSDIAVTGCTITTPENGIYTYTRSQRFYIADNVVSGPTSWTEAALGASGDNLGEGIVVTGPGHVIEHNRVSGFRDCISTLEDSEAVDQWSIDIDGNDMSECADDAVEADFCFHNCRVTSNRMTNVFMAVSSQPGLGGPTWVVRNVAYNVVLSDFKLQRGSVGDVVLHNTMVKNGDALGIYTSDVFSRQVFRNNLLVGGPGGTWNGYDNGSGRVIDLRAADPSGSYDHDALGSTTGTFTGWLGDVQFSSLAELRATTSEVHAVEVDPDTVFATAVAVPTNPFPGLAVPDLRPSGGAPVIDAAERIDGINDDYAGAGPDLGAYEAGQPLPGYGPR